MMKDCSYLSAITRSLRFTHSLLFIFLNNLLSFGRKINWRTLDIHLKGDVTMLLSKLCTFLYQLAQTKAADPTF